MISLELLVNSRRFKGWKSASITLSMEQLTPSFRLDYTAKSSTQEKRTPISAGDECAIVVDDKLIFVGNVDQASESIDSNSHSLSVSGRGRTGDLVDCAAEYKTGRGSWRKSTLEKIINDLCFPYDIKAKIVANTGEPFRRFAILDGETVFDAIDRAAKIRSLLLMEDREGDILVTTVAQAYAVGKLTLPGNVKSASRDDDFKDVFSNYTIKSQVESDKDDDSDKDVYVKESGTDPRIGRYRPVVIVSDSGESRRAIKDRVQFEINTRWARSRSIVYTVQGWYQDAESKTIWRPNEIVDIRDEFNEITEKMLISKVDLQLSDGGEVATLTCMDANAYTIKALPASKAVPEQTKKAEKKKAQL